MKKSIFVLCAALLMAACQPKTETISVNDFNANAAEFVDQVVNIEGVAVHVCQNSHMKLFLSENGEVKNTVLVMNIPGNDPFKDELIGKKVIVTGKVFADEEECSECEGEEQEGEHCGTESTANATYFIECEKVKAL